MMLNVIPFQANLNSDNIRLMSAMLCAALYPNVVQVIIIYCSSELEAKASVISIKLSPCLDLP